MNKIMMFSVVMLSIPFVTFAYLGEIGDFFYDVLDFIDYILVPLVFAVALVTFLFGMFRYFILGGGNEDDRKKGKQLMIWSITAFVIMVSIWGIVNMIAGGLFGYSSPPIIPGIPTL